MRLVLCFALGACGTTHPRSSPAPTKASPTSSAPRTAALSTEDSGFRQSDWKYWVDEDGDCQNTRQEVLIAESEIPVTFKTERNCEVSTGKWTCPFTGKVFRDPVALAVTHLVPLEAASKAGGSHWTSERQQKYANALDTEVHLVAVEALVNDKRAQQNPALWLPEKNACSYMFHWIEISLQWGLKVDTEIFSLHTSKCLSNSFASTCPKAFHDHPQCVDFSALTGEWSGRGSQSSGSSWDVKVKIAGPIGSRCATIDYDNGMCGGHWTCKEDRQGRGFTARETLTYGSGCVDNLVVQATLNDNNELVIKWRMTGETAEATLARPRAPI